MALLKCLFLKQDDILNNLILAVLEKSGQCSNQSIHRIYLLFLCLIEGFPKFSHFLPLFLEAWHGLF